MVQLPATAVRAAAQLTELNMPNGGEELVAAPRQAVKSPKSVDISCLGFLQSGWMCLQRNPDPGGVLKQRETLSFRETYREPLVFNKIRSIGVRSRLTPTDVARLQKSSMKLEQSPTRPAGKQPKLVTVWPNDDVAASAMTTLEKSWRKGKVRCRYINRPESTCHTLIVECEHCRAGVKIWNAGERAGSVDMKTPFLYVPGGIPKCLARQAKGLHQATGDRLTS